MIPATVVDSSKWGIPEGLKLADDHFNRANSTGFLVSTEVRDALHVGIKIAQQENYAQEINELYKKGQVSSKSQLQPLHPFLEKEGYLRVGGRCSIHIFHTIPNIS
jgi:hypothetical protein